MLAPNEGTSSSGEATVVVPSPPTRSPAKREALRHAATFTLVAVLLSLVVLITTILILQRHRRRLAALRKPKRRRGVVDAWGEAGRRLEVKDPADDDTVDIDPDELGSPGRDDDDPPHPPRRPR